ncbi:C2H2-type zinc finger protein [Candidatus Sororendozoicomonas aggregata]|uniref:C2H2-type zinc finger protein n=1 Tax=Candidatus Sororendozoicomonas aggregata TaxID=3073239 RepID=UPI002ED31AA5
MNDHVCEHCDKVFETKSALKKHKVIHSDDRPFVCEMCGSAFKWQRVLVDHLKTHADVADFKCTVCDKTFKTHTGLAHHKKIHSAIRPHKCNKCGKDFKQSYHLSQHMVSHSGGPGMFSCSICGGRFGRKDNALRHVKKRHPERNLTNPSSYVKTITETTRETLDNGEVVTCTTQTMVISPGLATSVSCMATETASAKIISQEHSNVTVTTVSQQGPVMSASTSTQVSASEPGPLVAHFHQEPDFDTDVLLDMLNEYSTASIQTRFGCLDFNPNDTFDDIPI